MLPGTKQQAIELLKLRWAKRFSFDLDESSWEALAAQYPAGSLLQAIRTTVRGKPSEVYERYLVQIQRLETERHQHRNPSWPPPDVQSL